MRRKARSKAFLQFSRRLEDPLHPAGIDVHVDPAERRIGARSGHKRDGTGNRNHKARAAEGEHVADTQLPSLGSAFHARIVGQGQVRLHHAQAKLVGVVAFLDVGQLAGSVGDDVLQEVSVLLASILAVVLQLADGVDDVLAIGVGAIDDALGLVAGVLDGLSGVRVGLGEDLVGRALGDDEGLGDGVVVGALFTTNFAPVAALDAVVNDGLIAAIADNAGIFLFLVLLGITDGDTVDDAVYLADKTVKMRVFTDENDKMNRSLADVGGGLLIVSQFTLYGDCRKGNRPSFTNAARPETAIPLYEAFIARCRESGLPVETGEFGADMKVDLLNDGPVTLWMDTKDMRR